MIKTPLSTVIGGAFWTPGATILGSSSKNLSQLIKSLFSLGEQGFAYDPNDLSTMFQDAAGTVPVTAVGQAVGLVLDKSKNKALGTNLIPQKSFAEGTTGWTLQSGWALIGDKVSNTTGSTALESPLTLEVGKLYRITLNTRRISEAGTLSIRSGETIDTQMLVASVNGIQTFLLRPTVSTNTLRFQSFQWQGDIYSVQVVQIFGNHAYQTTSASRPILQRNATTGAYYLAFDGTDDFLQTNNIDFTATDKVTVIASVHKPQNQIGYILELSADADNSNGAFKITSGSTNNTVFVSRGTAVASTVRTNAVPADIIITAKSRISNSSMTLTTNNGSPATSTASQGVGNYGNYPLYISRRGGTALPFNGHIYSLIGVGRLTTANETAAIEKELAKRVGVTLNV